MRNLPLILTICLLLLIAGAACSGSEDESIPAADDTQASASPPEAPTEVEPGDITVDQLAVMVLPQDEFGPDYASFDIDSESGFQDNTDAADSSIDPDDNADDMTAAGRVTGYDLSYSDDDIFDLNEEGVFSIGSTVELFTDAESASAYLRDQILDGERWVGQDLGGGYSLTSYDLFDVSDLGDEAGGISEAMTVGEQGISTSAVGFRVGPLVASLGFGSTASGDHEEVLQTWARTLETRIIGVLDGSLDEEPYPLPTPEGIPAAAPAAPPYPENMVLAIEDVPAGSTIDTEGYFDEDGHLTYNREFDVDFVGASGEISASLESNVALYADLTSVQAEFTLRQARVNDEAHLRVSADNLARSFGGEAGDVEFTNLPSSVGEASFAYQMVMDTNILDYTVIYYQVRVGRAVGNLHLVWIGAADPSVADALAARMAERMAAELAIAP